MCQSVQLACRVDDMHTMFLDLKRLRKLSLKGIHDTTLLEIAAVLCGNNLQTFELKFGEKGKLE